MGLTACGGGGGGGTSSSTSTTTPPTTTNPTPPASGLAIIRFNPQQAKVGDRITVEGSGLQAINRALIGSVEVKFSSVSDTQLTIEVPGNAQTGPIQLQTNGAIAQSAQPVTILGIPNFTSIGPTKVKSGDKVTIYGTKLKDITGVQLNGQAVDMLSGESNDTQIVFRISDKDRSGTVTLNYGTNGVITVSIPLNVDTTTTTAMGDFNPKTGLAGSNVEISGTNLDEITEVTFSPIGASSPIKPVVVNSTMLRVTVPADAASGRITLTHANGSKFTSNTDFTVIPKVIGKDLQPRSASAGQTITVTGSNLKEVTGVTINKIPVTLLTQTNDSITFNMPAGGGEVILLGKNQPDVIVGVLTDTTTPTPGKPTVAISRVEVAQTYLQAPGDQYQRLVPGKAALLRVYVAGKDGIASPAVQVVASAGSTVLGTVQLTGPTKLSAVPQASALDQTFNVKLPASWIRENLNLQIEVDPTKQTTSGASLTTRPVVGKPTNLRLLLVPFTIREGNLTAQMHDLAAVRKLLGQQLPIAETNIFVEQRAPYFLTKVDYVRNDKIIKDGKEVISSKKWGDALEELNELRNKEANQKHYYGLVPDPNFNGGTAGLGYVPDSGGHGGSRSAIGLDARHDADLSTMVHELGHNFGRNHVKCGGAAGPDPLFPYPEGGLGTTLIYDNVAGVIISPQDKKDVMSYCNGKWFADYSYFKIQERLESWLYPSNGTAPMNGYSSPIELLEVSGRIDENGATLRPVSGSTGMPERYQGEYQLVLHLSDGSQLKTNFSPTEVADASSPLAHFYLKLAKPTADVVNIEVLKAGKVLTTAKPRVAANMVGTNTGLKLTWKENAGKLNIYWNGNQFQFMTLVHVGSERTVLALQQKGSHAEIDISKLPVGGKWEITLSDGLNPRQFTVKR
ncbi:IPT/TIG domain-containing protein [Chitinimonas sp. PSY-7]|uniref:IPT/TIG domain-containing protein n=1 Tax=Chitinimonas sp. PSY-7 TaxID=3459088 RepID=UPI0040402697